jgi:hypothetical protein
VIHRAGFQQFQFQFQFQNKTKNKKKWEKIRASCHNQCLPVPVQLDLTPTCIHPSNPIISPLFPYKPTIPSSHINNQIPTHAPAHDLSFLLLNRPQNPFFFPHSLTSSASSTLLTGFVSSAGPLDLKKSAKSPVLLCSKAPSLAPALPLGMRLRGVEPGLRASSLEPALAVGWGVEFERTGWGPLCAAFVRGGAAVVKGLGALFEGGSWLRRKSMRDSSWGRCCCLDLLRGRASSSSSSYSPSSSSESEGMAYGSLLR